MLQTIDSEKILKIPFLKWAGGKRWLIKKLPKTFNSTKKILIEPFVGSASFFLNYPCEKAYLSDVNPDLINTYQWLKKSPAALIKLAKPFFEPRCNAAEVYYQLRAHFNTITAQSIERAALFIYLNRHGYNGLCRYNRQGIFNVPFGRYIRPYFPEEELWSFSKQAKRASFFCEPFDAAFRRARNLRHIHPSDTLIYCDPPYLPVATQTTSHFSGYSPQPFGKEEQLKLARYAENFSQKYFSTVLISNHALDETRQWYCNATAIEEFFVARRIGCSLQSRRCCKELLAAYLPLSSS